MLDINTRQSQLLNFIIKEYIDTAVPIGSSVLVSKCGLDISSATVRNEMAALEKQGYIFQPHTSAGRVPTEKGYKYFIEGLLGDESKTGIDDETERRLEQAVQAQDNADIVIKNLAKVLADVTAETILVGFSARDHYYTGIANFFRKPEFGDSDLAINLAEVVDDLDDVMFEVFPIVIHEPKILIGSENPFSEDCSAILTSLEINGQISVVGILGLMRMNYESNLGLIRHVKKILK